MAIDCGILIRTYDKDAEWLRYCLRSVKRYCEGFSDVVVSCAPSSQAVIAGVCAEEGVAPPKLSPEFASDYLGQQITKLHADRFVDAEHVMHVDADCVFFQTVRPEDFFEDGKPVLYMTAYDVLYRTGNPMLWQSITSIWLKRETDFDFMRRFPMVFPRAAYEGVRDFFRGIHGADMATAFKDRTDWHFSEFNFIGSYLYYERPELMRFRDTEQDPGWNRLSLKQFCQDGRTDRTPTDAERAEIAAMLNAPAAA